MTSTTQTTSPSEPSDIFKWSDIPTTVYIKIVLVGILFFFFFSQEIITIVKKWSDPSWSHGILIPLFSLYFLYQKKKEISELDTKPNYVLGMSGLIFFLILYVFNYVQFKFGYGKPIIMLAALGAMVLFLGGWKLVRFTWLPIAFLFFAIPLPQQIYTGITIPMRIWASQVSTIILNLFPDLQATAKGVIIDVFYKGQPLEPALNVAEACSGMRLLMAFVALGVAMAYLQDRPIWQRLILLISTAPIAIFCNIVRVTITGCIYIFGDPQYAKGAYHDALGMAMLPLAFIIYGGIAWVMNHLFVEEEPVIAEETLIIQRKPGNAQAAKES